jgi:integrase
LQRAQKVAPSTTDKDRAILKAFFNWCIGHQLAVSNPVRRVKLFHEDNSRLRIWRPTSTSGWLRRPVPWRPHRVSTPSPFLEEKIVLRGRYPPEAGWPVQLAVGSDRLCQYRGAGFAHEDGPAALTASQRHRHTTLQELLAAREPDGEYVFPHKSGPKAGEPVQAIKNGFHAALEIAGIENFTWHDCDTPSRRGWWCEAPRYGWSRNSSATRRW